LIDIQSRAAQLRQFLVDRRCLLVVDDLWRVAQVRDLIDACDASTGLLLTMRSPQLADDLQLADYYVPVLDPESARTLLGSAGRYGGFAGEAVAVDPDGAAQLAAALGHLPLALQVAARYLQSRGRAEGVAGAIKALHVNLDALLLDLRAADSRPGITDPQPALDAVLALSYDHLLDDAGRRALRRLAVFGGQPLTFSSDAMDAVWEADEVQGVALRMNLVDAGLLERSGDRYSLHQIVTRFAARRLAADPVEEQTALLAHAAFYAQVVSGWDETLKTGRMTYASPLEWENVAAAIERLVAAGDDELARALLPITHHWRNVLFNNHDPRRSRWLEAAAVLAARLGAPWELANVLRAQGDVLYFLKQTSEALGKYEEALGLFRAVGDRLGEANVLLSLGDLQRAAEHFVVAWSSYQGAEMRYAAIGDRYSLGRVLYRMGDWHTGQNQPGEAIPLYLAAIEHWESIGLPDLADQILRPRLEAAQNAHHGAQPPAP
jgi:tetratricopeptide (TPR) repeat protein